MAGCQSTPLALMQRPYSTPPNYQRCRRAPTRSGADGATAPETLRQKDCSVVNNLESSTKQVLTEGEPRFSGNAQSLRYPRQMGRSPVNKSVGVSYLKGGSNVSYCHTGCRYYWRHYRLRTDQPRVSGDGF